MQNADQLLYELKLRACRAHELCNQLRLKYPEIAELGDDGELHDAIHDILRVDTPTASQPEGPVYRYGEDGSTVTVDMTGCPGYWHNKPAQGNGEPVADDGYVPFPPLPGPLVDHPKLGPMFDRMQMHSYALRMVDSAKVAAAERVMVPERLSELSAAATPGAWRSMREGNQFVDTSYMPTMKCVGASRIDGPKRPWNPHALIAFGFKPEEYEKVRMTDADADFVCALVNWFRSLSVVPEDSSRV